MGPVHGTAGYLHESRFIKNENDLTTRLSKYLAYNSPDFGKKADHSLDEFIKNESSAANENANNQAYHPSHKLLHYNEEIGVPDFARYAARRANKLVVNESSADFHPGDAWERASSYMSEVWAQKPKGTAFAKLTGRDKRFGKETGIPAVTREEKAATDKKNKEYVSFVSFLPNSVK